MSSSEDNDNDDDENMNDYLEASAKIFDKLFDILEGKMNKVSKNNSPISSRESSPIKNKNENSNYSIK